MTCQLKQVVSPTPSEHYAKWLSDGAPGCTGQKSHRTAGVKRMPRNLAFGVGRRSPIEVWKYPCIAGRHKHIAYVEV